MAAPIATAPQLDKVLGYIEITRADGRAASWAEGKVPLHRSARGSSSSRQSSPT